MGAVAYALNVLLVPPQHIMLVVLSETQASRTQRNFPLETEPVGSGSFCAARFYVMQGCPQVTHN
jgi:hypothetical protein